MAMKKFVNALKNIGIFLIYIVMFVLVCIFFTGNGTFIYEGF